MDAPIGSRIKQLRVAKKWSQMDLAAAADVSPRTIGTWEKTGRVPMEQLARLAKALEVTEGDLSSAVELPPVTEIDYRGWRFTFQAAPGATPEQIRKAEAAVLDTALARLRELGLDEE